MWLIDRVMAYGQSVTGGQFDGRHRLVLMSQRWWWLITENNNSSNNNPLGSKATYHIIISLSHTHIWMAKQESQLFSISGKKWAVRYFWWILVSEYTLSIVTWNSNGSRHIGVSSDQLVRGIACTCLHLCHQAYLTGSREVCRAGFSPLTGFSVILYYSRHQIFILWAHIYKTFYRYRHFTWLCSSGITININSLWTILFCLQVKVEGKYS